MVELYSTKHLKPFARNHGDERFAGDARMLVPEELESRGTIYNCKSQDSSYSNLMLGLLHRVTGKNNLCIFNLTASSTSMSPPSSPDPPRPHMWYIYGPQLWDGCMAVVFGSDREPTHSQRSQPPRPPGGMAYDPKRVIMNGAGWSCLHGRAR